LTGTLKTCSLIPWWNALCAIKSTGLLDLGLAGPFPS
jgi:hypothetical protein